MTIVQLPHRVISNNDDDAIAFPVVTKQRTIKNSRLLVCNLHQAPRASFQNLRVRCVVMTPQFAGYDLKCWPTIFWETVYPRAIGPRRLKVTGPSSA